jgi:hypothetical protein
MGKKITVEKKALPSGKHSIPSVVKIGSRKFVFKRSSLGRGLSLEQARIMVNSVNAYQKKLAQIGVNVSKVHWVRVMPDSSVKGKFFVASLEQYIGRNNASDLLRTLPPIKAVDVYKKLLAEVGKVLRVSSPKGANFAGVLIDSKPKNYVLSKEGKMVFIDFYTPKLLDAKGVLYPFFPQLHPTRTLNELQTRFEEKNALIHILLAHSIADRPDLRLRFEKATLSYLRRIKENNVASYIENAISKDYVRPDIIKEETIKQIRRT